MGKYIKQIKIGRGGNGYWGYVIEREYYYCIENPNKIIWMTERGHVKCMKYSNGMVRLFIPGKGTRKEREKRDRIYNYKFDISE